MPDRQLVIGTPTADAPDLTVERTSTVLGAHHPKNGLALLSLNIHANRLAAESSLPLRETAPPEVSSDVVARPIQILVISKINGDVHLDLTAKICSAKIT